MLLPSTVPTSFWFISFSLIRSTATGAHYGSIIGHILPHEFPDYLSSRFVLRLANLKELFPELALNPYP